MIYPSLNDLMKGVESRYSLVVATAKRAREITGGEKSLVKCDSDKPVTMAINEIFHKKITFIEASDKSLFEIKQENDEKRLLDEQAGE